MEEGAGNSRLTVVEVCNAHMPSAVDRTFMSSVVGANGNAPDPYVLVKTTKDTRDEAGALVMDQIGVTRRCEYKTSTSAPVFRFHADTGVEASDDDVLVVELWDYDSFSSDDFLGVAVVRIGDLAETPRVFQLFGGKIEPGGTSEQYPTAFNPDWLSKTVEQNSSCAWVRLRRCFKRGSGLPTTPGRENPFISRSTLYFLRHGESKWNKAQAQFDAIGMLSDVDHPLDAAGVKQCQEFNQTWKSEVQCREDSEATDATALDDFLSADAIYASPLCRTAQTCLIALDGHPALGADATKPQLTLLSSAREVKKVGGMDTVGGHVGDAILDNVKAQTSKVLGPEETEKIMGHVETDAYDTMDAWWTGAEDRDNDKHMRARFYGFASSLRFSHRSGLSDKPTIVVGHSLFMREFCTYFMDPDLADADPLAMKLTQFKLANACMVKLDLEFDDGALDEIVRIVGVTPMFGLQLHSKENDDDARRGGSSLADTLCCCRRRPEDDGARPDISYNNPMNITDAPNLRLSRRSLQNISSPD